LDAQLLHTIFTEHTNIITIEDGAIKGGFGSTILEFAAENNYQHPIKILGIPDTFIEHGAVVKLQGKIGLDPLSLSKAFLNFT